MLTTGPGDDVLDVPTDAPQPAGALGTGAAAPRAPRWSVAFGAAAVRAEPVWSRYLAA